MLLSLFPNGLLPDGHMNSYHDGDVYPVDVSTESSSKDGNVITQARQSGGTESNHGSRSTAAVIKNALSNPALYLSDIYYSSQYDPNSLQYMLDFFRHVAQTIPASPPSPSTELAAHEAIPIEPMQGSARDMLQDRAGIIVLREDLDFYAIPPRKDIEQAEMMEVKRAAGKALLKQDGIFSGLRKSEEPGTTEQHLIEMLTAGYVYSRCLSHNSTCNHADFSTVDSTTTTNGAIALENPTRQSSAALLSPDSEQTSAATICQTTPLAWPKSCYYSGENQPEDAGGKASIWKTLMVLRANSRFGFDGFGRWRWYVALVYYRVRLFDEWLFS